MSTPSNPPTLQDAFQQFVQADNTYRKSVTALASDADQVANAKKALTEAEAQATQGNTDVQSAADGERAAFATMRTAIDAAEAALPPAAVKPPVPA